MIPRLLRKKMLVAKKSILLIGPRQTGKSTLVKSLKPDLFINLSLETEYFRFSSDPALLESLIRAQKPKTVFIDEIQRIPSLLNTIQAIIDDFPNAPRFYLTGSSARKLKRGHANLLPGRVYLYSMGGLCARELGYEIDIQRALAFGLLPEPYLDKSETDRKKLLQTYAATYLKEEIQAETLVRNIPGFARFLNTAAELSGKICDFSKIASKSKVSRSSCLRFMEILEDTLIANRISVFDLAGEADIIKHPKLYFFDAGVLNGLLGGFENSSDRTGALFEHFIYSQLRNSAFALDEPLEIQYFRTRHGLEVDFIVKLRGKIWAIEVKAGSIHKSDLDGLKSFRKYYPEVQKCVAVGLKESPSKKRVSEQVLICGWKDLLLEMGL